MEPAKLKALMVYACLTAGGFAGGMVTALYPDWRGPVPDPLIHPGRFIALPPLHPKRQAPQPGTLPAVDVIDIENVRKLAGRRARVRGKVYRVGHSSRSDTYFLDFGPSRSFFTAVVFASAARLFERDNIDLRRYEGQEVELVGRIEDDPRYGLEMIVNEPAQIRRLDR